MVIKLMLNNHIYFKDNFNYGRTSGFDSIKGINIALPIRNWFVKDLSSCNIISLSDHNKQKQDNFVFGVVNDNDNHKTVVTGNYIGNFKLKNEEGKEYSNINIESRFSEILLNRMLNVTNNVFLQDVNITSNTNENKSNIIKYIIGYLFIQQLNKAYLLGFPKVYKTVKYHKNKVYGNIDINNYIKRDIPFIGKISSKKNERLDVQEIIDVLNSALLSIDDIFIFRDVQCIVTMY